MLKSYSDEPSPPEVLPNVMTGAVECWSQESVGHLEIVGLVVVGVGLEAWG